MIKLNKVIISSIILMSIFLMFSANFVLAGSNENQKQEKTVEVAGEAIQTQIKQNESTMLRFQERTQIMLNCNVNMQLNAQCEAQKIGNKEFGLEIEAEGDLEMTMTCTEEQAELGLQKGNTYQVRNRNRRHRYQEGFCVRIQVNGSCQAKLMIKANSDNQEGTWARYNEGNQEWEAVQTSEQNGYLVAETNYFSYWTVLIPEDEEDTAIIPGFIGLEIFVVVGVFATILVVAIKRKK